MPWNSPQSTSVHQFIDSLSNVERLAIACASAKSTLRVADFGHGIAVAFQPVMVQIDA